MGKGTAVIRYVGGLVLILALTSCTQFRNHGYAPSDADLANIVVGTDTRETVATLVGHPGASGLLEDSNWFYVESRFRHFAFQAPKEIEREVVAISFDTGGRVANIERFGLEQGRVVTLSRRVTATSKVKIPLLRRLFGNLGQGGGLF